MQEIDFKNSRPLSYLEVLTVVNYNLCWSNMDKFWSVAVKINKYFKQQVKSLSNKHMFSDFTEKLN